MTEKPVYKNYKLISVEEFNSIFDSIPKENKLEGIVESNLGEGEIGLIRLRKIGTEKRVLVCPLNTSYLSLRKVECERGDRIRLVYKEKLDASDKSYFMDAYKGIKDYCNDTCSFAVKVITLE